MFVQKNIWSLFLLMKVKSYTTDTSLTLFFFFFEISKRIYNVSKIIVVSFKTWTTKISCWYYWEIIGLFMTSHKLIKTLKIYKREFNVYAYTYVKSIKYMPTQYTCMHIIKLYLSYFHWKYKKKKKREREYPIYPNWVFELSPSNYCKNVNVF